MAGNRKLPFGYRMERGTVVVHPEEAALVRNIFRQYILGASYRELVDNLRDQDVSYDQDKLWNKNMVARILENRKYVGLSGWPPIITAEQFEWAGEKRSSKANPTLKTDAQKVLRRLSGGNCIKGLEHTVLCLLNQLITDPKQICTPQAPPSNLSRIAALQLALTQELEQQSADEDTAKQLAMELASARYEAISDQEYETERLRRLVQKHTPMQELNADLLRSAVKTIQTHGKKIRIYLKNGQIYERM